MARIDRPAALVASLLCAACVGRGGVITPTSNPEVPLESLHDDGTLRVERYEYYGWHYFVRATVAGLRSVIGGLDHLFDDAGCSGDRFEHYGWHFFLACAPPGALARPSSLGQLSERPELLFEFDGCWVYRFEYYGWHYFARCGVRSASRPASKLTEPVKVLFETDSCRAFAFEYYGWHHVAHCDDGSQGALPTPPEVTQPVELLWEAGGCSGHRYEFYGWHHFTRCAGVPMSFTTNTETYRCGDRWCTREYEVQAASLPGR